MTKRVSYEVVAVDQPGCPFGGAFVKRTDRGDSETAKLPLPFAIVRAIETATTTNGRESYSLNKHAVAFAYTKSVADAIASSLNACTTHLSAVA